MIRGRLLIAAYALVLSVPPALVLGFGGGHGHEHEEANFVLSLGKAFALEGAVILLLQPILAARFKWLERPFGQDMVIRFHRNMAILAACLLILHPVLVAAGEDAWFILTSIELPWYVWAGKIALLLLLANAALSLGFKRLPYSFETWRLGHDVLGPAMLAVLLAHALAIGPDVQNTPLVVFFPALFAVSAGLFVWHRILRPAHLARFPWTVTNVEAETEEVTSITMAPYPGAGYAHLPGQFHFIKLLRGRGLPEEEHHFTISSAPNSNGTVTSTIKSSGDFTSTVRETKPGDQAVVHGPFGRFSNLVHPEEKRLVFIAGGIGVTPVMSMLRDMRDNNRQRPATLIYANRHEEEIVFRKELDSLAGELPNFEVVHVLSRPNDAWAGESGHVDADLIKRHTTFTDDTGWYLCGPEGLIDAVISALESMGVPKNRMHREIFRFI
jgi:predicted ferric reductase